MARISLTGRDHEQTYPITAKTTHIALSSETKKHETTGSKSVKLNSLTNFEWEYHYHWGHIVAVHRAGSIVAYAITQQSGISFVRVMNRHTSTRLLVKGFKGAIQDLGFAYSDDVLLGVVDLTGTLTIFEFTELGDELSYTTILRADANMEATLQIHRLKWCPYIPDPDDVSSNDDGETYFSRSLLLCHGSQCELWYLDLLDQQFASKPIEVDANQVKSVIHISEHKKDIIDASFSPDGGAVATASKDGHVLFWQFEDKTPFLAHKWAPHDGRPLSGIWFLDDCKNPMAFWMHVITGAHQNSELKIWRTDDWSCIQTLIFQATPHTSLDCQIKVCIDATAQYVVLSDIDRTSILVLALRYVQGKNKEGNTVSLPNFVSISEFPLVQTCLDMDLFEAKKTLARDLAGYTGEITMNGCDKEIVILQLLSVCSKSLQYMEIDFEPDATKEEELLGAVASMNDDSDTAPAISSDEDNEKNGLLTPTAFMNNTEEPEVKDVDLLADSTLTHVSSDSTFDQEAKISNLLDDSNSLLPPVPLGQPSPPKVLSAASMEVSRIIANAPRDDDTPIDVQNQESGRITPTPFDAPSSSLPDITSALPERPNGSALGDAPLDLGIMMQPVPMEPAIFDDIPDIQQAVESRSYPDLAEIIQLQKDEIQSLRVTMQQQQSEMNRAIEALVVQLSLNQNAQKEQMDGLISRFEETQNLSRISANVSQSLIVAVNTKLEQVLKSELERGLKSNVKNLGPVLCKALDPIKGQLTTEVSNKLTASDIVFKEAVDKILTSRQFLETVGEALGRTNQHFLQNEVKGMFLQSILPQFEQSCQVMFNKLNSTFQHGTEQYLTQTEAKLNEMKLARLEQREPQLDQLKTEISNVKSSIGQLKKSVVTHLEKGMQDLLAKLSDNIKSEMNTSLSEQTASISEVVVEQLRSRAVSPTPQGENAREIKKSMIKQLITNGSYDQAFQAALDATDLELVNYVCQLITPCQLFTDGECPFTQPVLMSFIYQLSMNISNQPELMHAYLQESIMFLDPMNTNTKSNVPKVIENLRKKIDMLLSENPSAELSRSYKLLKMAAMSIRADL